MKEGLRAVIETHDLPAYVTGVGAKGSVIYSTKPVREYRDAVGIDERITYLAWLFQQNRGVFKSPWTKQETWTLSVWHTRGGRPAVRRQLRGVRRRGHADRPSGCSATYAPRTDSRGRTCPRTTMSRSIPTASSELTKERDRALAEREAPRSIEYREEAKRRLPGGVSCVVADAAAAPDLREPRRRARSVWDIDGNEYVDYHNGYGVMVVGHAHPKIVEAVQRRVELGTHFAQPTEDALIVRRQPGRALRPAAAGGSATRAPRRRSTPCGSCGPRPAAT